MNLDLKGKRALVCGSTQGIGKAAAVELALLGANITLMARNEEKLKAVSAALPNNQAQTHDFVVADFGSVEQVSKAIKNFKHTGDIDILINNTGGPPGGLASDATVADFLKAFELHLLCNQTLVQAVIGGMKRKKLGTHCKRYFNLCENSDLRTWCFKYNKGSCGELVKNTFA
jgi:3-oxoacyl-[acyl-carrier protein] reductase